jgi:hypothetical protein
MYLGHYIDKLIIINSVKITDICITPDMTSCHTIVITYLIMLLTEGAIKNGKTQGTGNIGPEARVTLGTRHKMDTNKTKVQHRILKRWTEVNETVGRSWKLKNRKFEKFKLNNIFPRFCFIILCWCCLNVLKSKLIQYSI